VLAAASAMAGLQMHMHLGGGRCSASPILLHLAAFPPSSGLQQPASSWRSSSSGRATSTWHSILKSFSDLHALSKAKARMRLPCARNFQICKVPIGSPPSKFQISISIRRIVLRNSPNPIRFVRGGGALVIGSGSDDDAGRCSRH
jgi:hypothetical protein